MIRRKSNSLSKHSQNFGFTIVELLIVIVIIGVLAAITMFAYNGIQKRAQDTKIRHDQSQLDKAIRLAREQAGGVLIQVTYTNYTAGGCVSGVDIGTDLATLPKSHSCWRNYQSALDRISVASGVNVRNLVDPWGWPYFIDENEGEYSHCVNDVISTWERPFRRLPNLNTWHTVGYSSFRGCAS